MTGIAKWERIVRPYFDFLLQHGFSPDPSAAYSEWYGTSIAYRSAVSAVIVTRSVEFGRAEVQLVRLVDGAYPDYASFFRDSAPLNRTLFDNVVIARAPDRLIEIQAATGLKKAAIERQLALWSQLVRDVAPDFLRGADTVFNDAKGVIRGRVREHPQQVEIWLPDGASPEEESSAIEEQRSHVPSEVEIVARRYRQSPPPRGKG